ncbi:NAD-dependent deacylase [Rufibacter glacialis]|uniref:NAD-dependent protein deacylase n=1 Tax=Rufibacter glacialis TaxID=1259555 RepID=A0A5M8Q9H5_9BACT|nr:NAD-dependent deacylase [Rufibacter glacialis]KAA6431793.1 NAD-dependent deacylase [Rufibacter glacialis]GGK81509.1 NAD-dependent protein deacylase [Rufibacter glacialis]
MKQKVVVLTGAGISAESGLATFRDANGLWEGHDVMEVASPEGWQKNPKLVLQFYNERRKSALAVEPNAAHKALVDLEQKYEVSIITQNVDDLHERAGSTNILHLHGKLFESRSTKDERLVYPMKGWELKLGDLCEKGSQLRPNIVWFGEAVPLIEKAAEETMHADYLLIIGTSLQVYPAAGLLAYAPHDTPIYLIDPNTPAVSHRRNFTIIQEKATVGVPALVKKLLGE